MKEAVILLHGIFRTSKSMNGFARFMKKNGYETININYPSTKYPIEKIIHIIHEKIKAFGEYDKIHFIAYSMGGLVARAYLCHYQPENLGRVVMIATPNNGSEIADILKNVSIYKKLYGPAGQQLITLQDSISHLFSRIDYDLGIIAGDKPLDILSARFIPKPNDGKVSIKSTMIEGMKDHITVGCNHTYFPHSKKAWGLALDFIRNGKFNR